MIKHNNNLWSTETIVFLKWKLCHEKKEDLHKCKELYKEYIKICMVEKNKEDKKNTKTIID